MGRLIRRTPARGHCAYRTPAPSTWWGTYRALVRALGGRGEVLECDIERYRPVTSRNPSSTRASLRAASEPTRETSACLSMVATCETLTTEFFGSPVSRGRQRTLPGAPASSRLEVIATTMTVRIGLWLSRVASPLLAQGARLQIAQQRIHWRGLVPVYCFERFTDILSAMLPDELLQRL